MYKSYLQIHLVLVVKYRKRLLIFLGESVKQIFVQLSNEYDFEISLMEEDMDHIHLLITYPPTISVTQIVRCLKQNSTWELWKTHSNYLKKHFWKERTFWSDGYFVASVGQASIETIKNIFKIKDSFKLSLPYSYIKP